MSLLARVCTSRSVSGFRLRNVYLEFRVLQRGRRFMLSAQPRVTIFARAIHPRSPGHENGSTSFCRDFDRPANRRIADDHRSEVTSAQSSNYRNILFSNRQITKILFFFSNHRMTKILFFFRTVKLPNRYFS